MSLLQYYYITVTIVVIVMSDSREMKGENSQTEALKASLKHLETSIFSMLKVSSFQEPYFIVKLQLGHLMLLSI